jgi:serine/threonine protein kinase
MKLPQIQHHEFVEMIGEGSCGYAYRCRYRERDERVVKLVKAMSVNQALYVNSMKTVAGAKPHPNLVDVCDYRFSESPSYVITSLHGHSATEEGGPWQPDTIESLMGRLPLDQAMRLIEQMADGLAHLHKLEVPHTALKPSNVFVDRQPDGSRQIRIADWSEGYVEGAHYLELGDRGFYAAPEQLAHGDVAKGRPKAWDVYAFGVLSYRLMTGLLPRLDPQFDEYMEAIQESDPNSILPAEARHSVTTDPARYVEWIYAQPDIIWGGPAPSQAEAGRRRVVERCLAIDPNVRYGDMREVVAEFRDLESSALLRRMERDMSTRHQQQIEEVEQRVSAAEEMGANRRRLLIRWRAYAAGLVLVFGLLGWAGVKLVQREAKQAEEAFVDRENEFSRELAQQKLRYEIALAEKDTTVKTVAKSAQQSSNAVDAARSVQQRAQTHGDQLFEMLLGHRHSDVPGYREERRRLLLEARDYYESMLEVYANDNEARRRSADGYRYLGEIYAELGDTRRASGALKQAADRFTILAAGATLPAQDGGTRTVDADGNGLLSPHVALAQIQQLQAELAVDEKPAAQETLTAIDRAQTQWNGLATAQPKQVEWRLNSAENRLLRTQVLAVQGDMVAQMEELETAADELVAIHDEAPENDRATAALGEVFFSMADKLAAAGEDEEAQALYEQSITLFSEAVRLNGAVDDYQLGMAQGLAQLGRMRRDPEALKDAVTVLNVAQSKDPEDAAAASALAACLGVMAEMQRDGGEGVKALELERRGVEVLETALAGSGAAGGTGSGGGWSKASRELRVHLAERYCHLSELYGDIEQFAEAKKAVDRGIELMADLLRASPGSDSTQRLLARAQGLAAFASEKIGDKEGARALYTAALTQWQTVAKAHPDDTQASEGQAWAQRQLDALQ